MKYPIFEGLYDGKDVWSIRARGKIKGIHPEFKCTRPTCVLHKPPNHHMSDFPLVFRRDLRTFHRICEHQVAHPDPDCSNAMRAGGEHECSWSAVSPCRRARTVRMATVAAPTIVRSGTNAAQSRPRWPWSSCTTLRCLWTCPSVRSRENEDSRKLSRRSSAIGWDRLLPNPWRRFDRLVNTLP